MSNWYNIWNKRKANEEILSSNDMSSILVELKKANGFDLFNDDGLSVGAYLSQYEEIKKYLSLKIGNFSKVCSVYEVGCGSGANLYLYAREGKVVGGGDFSPALITIARKILPQTDLTCNEAIKTPIRPQYDVVISGGVFSYFPSYKYAETVLEIMNSKARYAIGITNMFDIEKKEEYLSFKRANIENYDVLYKGLRKLFYSREWFRNFAVKHNLEIVFSKTSMEGYWNNGFMLNCFLYKP